MMAPSLAVVHSRLRHIFCAVTLASLLFDTSNALAERQCWVATIAANRFDNLANKYQLRYCVNDAKALYEELAQGYSSRNPTWLKILDDGDAGSVAPTRRNIETHLADFLQRPGKDDLVVVFCALHGILGKDDQARIVPADYDPQRPVETSVPLEWLRDLLIRDTRANSIVLLLDMCHSGKIGDYSQLGTRTLETLFDPNNTRAKPAPPGKRFYVLTSCLDDETSLEDSELSHGVFTHWLLRGMRGAADADNDAIISMDELFELTNRWVPLHVNHLATRYNKHLKQHPRRFLLGPDHGNLPLLALNHRPVKDSLHYIADSFDEVLRIHLDKIDGKPPIVAILEFGMTLNGKPNLRGPLGGFGRLASERVATVLLGRQNGLPVAERYYQLWDGQLDPPGEMNLLGLTESDVRQRNLKAIAEQRNLDFVVHGNFVRIEDNGPSRLKLDVEILECHRGTTLARFTQWILVSEELWLMLGASRDQRLEQVPQPVATATAITATATTPASVVQWNASAVNEHPLRHTKSSLGITIRTGPQGGGKRTAEWLPETAERPNELAFETSEGNEIELKIDNRVDRDLAVMVFIDGLSQISPKRRLPSECSAWIIRKGKSLTIDSWHKTPIEGANDEILKLAGNKLLVVSAPKSVASQQRFQDSIGQIKILAYDVRKAGLRPRGSSGIGVGLGVENERMVRVVTDIEPDFERNVANYVISYRDNASE
jgi:hypothetical protein